MTTTTATPRFIHVQESIDAKHSGMTIAYIRADKKIFFSYALVSRNDQYDKRIGRELTTDRLYKFIDAIYDAESNVDSDNMYGMIEVNTVVDISGLDSALADHHVANMSMMDFKHGFLSSIIVAFINSRRV
jgi:hypothetical protein